MIDYRKQARNKLSGAYSSAANAGVLQWVNMGNPAKQRYRHIPVKEGIATENWTDEDVQDLRNEVENLKLRLAQYE